MLKKILLAGFALSLAACGPKNAEGVSEPVAEAPVAVATLPTTAAITAGDLALRIEELAHDKYEGRAPGTQAGEKSARWVASEMERLGLEGGAKDGSFFQKVGMVETIADAANSQITITKGDEVFPLALTDDAVLWTKHQSSEPISWADSPLVFVGYGSVAPEYNWNDYEGVDVAGKTVVMLVNDPGFATKDPALFKGNAMTYYGRWTYKFEEAARQGATGAIVIHETEPASYGWGVVSGSWSGPQADLIRADAGASRTQFESWITRDKAVELFAAAGLDFEREKAKAATSDFTPVAMDGLTASGKITQTTSTMDSVNVVGTIEGKKYPDEYVLFVAHWDHLGKKTGEKTGAPGEDFYDDDIFNGAVDNATGTAALLEMAEYIATQELDRTAIFLAVTLEESGLLGSAYYAENPTVPLSSVVAGLNIDAMLPTGRTKDMIVVGYGASQLEDMLAEILVDQDRVIVPDPKPEAGYFYRSDHISLAKKGVPMLYADGGYDLRDGGEAAGRAFAEVYTVQRYHKPMDEYDASWDLSGMQEDVTALTTLGLQIANAETWPTWYPGNEFEEIRAASLARGD